jgi:hypothetical protein
MALTQLPPELFELWHLRRLNHGRGIRIEGKEKLGQAGDAIGSPNQIDGQLGSIIRPSNALRARRIGVASALRPV